MRIKGTRLIVTDSMLAINNYGLDTSASLQK